VGPPRRDTRSFPVHRSSVILDPYLPSAFTLIELLAAVALIGLVGMTMFATLRIAVRARASTEAAVEPGRTADIAFETIRLDLENAQPPRGVLAGTTTAGNYLDDRGRDADTILFFTTAPGAQHVSADGEVRRVEYLVLSPDGPQGDHLLVRRVIHNLLSPYEPPADDEVLLRGIGGFNLRFYDPTTATWVDQWDSTQYDNNLPSVVEVSIDLDRPDTGRGRPERAPRPRSSACAAPVRRPRQNTSG
jgi:prepilin-type N-terminal cleavage/methylation domain-containing protein